MDGVPEKEIVRQIEQVRGRIGQLEGDLNTQKVRLISLVSDLWTTRGYVVGMIVHFKGAEYRVSQFDPSPRCLMNNGKPWAKGNPKKKDGTFGKAERHLFGDWTEAPSL